MKSGIYQIINIINEKKYIGSSNNLNKRWRDHRNSLRMNEHHNILLQRIYNKYGDKTLKFSILEEINDPQELLKKEQFYIDLINPEYNVCKTAGSPLGYKHTEETKEKMRKPKSEETKKKMSKSQKGKILSEETKKKMSISRTGEKNPMYGKHYSRSEETKKKMSLVKSGINNPMFGKNHTEETKKKISNTKKER
jgi:group I intron endonuclease